MSDDYWTYDDTEDVKKHEQRSRMRARVAKMRAEQNNPLALLKLVERNDIDHMHMVTITDVNRNSENELGITPLIQAILHKNYEMCLYLLKNGVNPNHVTNMGHTALSLLLLNIDIDKKGCSITDLRLVLLLLRYGANTELETSRKVSSAYLRDLGYEVEGIYLRKRLTRRQSEKN